MTDNIGSEKLRSFAQRRARLEDEKDALSEDISTINAEAKAEGYNLRAFNMAVKRYRMTPEKRAEAEQLQMEFELYVGSIMGFEDDE